MKMNRIGILLAVVGLGGLDLGAACPTTLNVGFQVARFGSVTTAVWYPTEKDEAPYKYSIKTKGSIALNAAPAHCGVFPMVVFSHGFMGCGTQSVFITEQLARQGFVVAAPDHADAACTSDGPGFRIPPRPQVSFRKPNAWTDQTYVDRRQDIGNVITGMLASPVFGKIVNPGEIAGMGHSLGGYTILGMIGGWPSWKDPRIKSALLLSPYVEPFEAQNTVGKIGVPVMYQGGTLDFGITPKLAGVYDQTPSPKFFAELRKAGHFAWTNLACSKAGNVGNCLSTVPNAALIDQYGVAFFDSTVLREAEPLLIGSGAGLADYRHSVK
ncbi:MAG TPA: hypothetical protein VKR43_06485 [Bryobacteraceae bacterium]|nr:hypothetical protein [Bryobacteraceae bacterium]